MTVQTTKTTVAGNDVLGTKDKVLYYLIIGEGEDKAVLNVGEKSYLTVQKLIEKETNLKTTKK